MKKRKLKNVVVTQKKKSIQIKTTNNNINEKTKKFLLKRKLKKKNKVVIPYLPYKFKLNISEKQNKKQNIYILHHYIMKKN